MDTMNKKLFVSLASLLAIAALAVMPAMAQAETITLVSGESNSLCINPTAAAFKPEIPTKNLKEHPTGFELNDKPLTTSHKGAFPDTGKSCSPETPSHAIAMGGPGLPAYPYGSSIPGASWVSYNATGEDATNEAPKYYIYDATFELCGNQAEAASMSGEMFADNVGAVFLNGTHLGNQKPNNPLTNHENFSGTPFPFVAGGAPPFVAGKNTLQFVVLDESNPYTALDFSATITVPPCLPRWYSNGKLIKPGEVEPVATAGTLVLRSTISNGKEVKEYVTKCKKKDKELITNPPEGAGVDEVTEWVLSGCSAKPSPCPVGTKLEIISQNLNWPTHLIAGPPIRDVIESIVWEVKCSGTLLDIFSGTLAPTIGNSIDLFGPGSGTLTDPLGNTLTVTGKETLKGPPGDEKITAG
jgi:hypothetical protein